VARDMEAGRPGYDKLPRARLWYQVGMLYQQQGRFAEALEAYARVTERDESEGLVRAYSGLRRGEIFLAQKNLEDARAEYERVAALPYEGPKREAEKRLRSLGG
ncbi:MAG: tetratricopeptide repeat protein, partial [Terriglobia bacterium]